MAILGQLGFEDALKFLQCLFCRHLYVFLVKQGQSVSDALAQLVVEVRLSRDGSRPRINVTSLPLLGARDLDIGNVIV